jgi:hypothetical protein
VVAVEGEAGWSIAVTDLQLPDYWGEVHLLWTRCNIQVSLHLLGSLMLDQQRCMT